jgi:hypothetical protein
MVTRSSVFSAENGDDDALSSCSSRRVHTDCEEGGRAGKLSGVSGIRMKLPRCGAHLGAGIHC